MSRVRQEPVSGAKPRANMKRLPTNAKPLLKICVLHQRFSINDQQWRLFLCMCVPGVLPHLQEPGTIVELRSARYSF